VHKTVVLILVAATSRRTCHCILSETHGGERERMREAGNGERVRAAKVSNENVTQKIDRRERGRERAQGGDSQEQESEKERQRKRDKEAET